MPDKSTRILISSLYGQKWQEFSGVNVIGAVHNGDRWLCGQALAETIAAALESGNMPEVLRTFNGSFAFATRYRGKVAAAVDWMRSYPLFWTETPERVCISNNAWELAGSSQGGLLCGIRIRSVGGNFIRNNDEIISRGHTRISTVAGIGVCFIYISGLLG
jgi:hypothetical protein